MTSTTNQQEIAHARRRLVARLRLRGLTTREIVTALAKEYLNPDTELPWTLRTIYLDIRALDAQWRAEALGDTTDQKAAILAEIREARRAAWGKTDLRAVAEFIKQEIDLLGLDEPTKYERVESYAQYTDDALLAEITAIARRAGERARAAGGAT